MTTSSLEKYQTELENLTTNDFEKELLAASLKNLLNKDNKLRFNNFACGIRELSRHILLSLAPNDQVEKCCWYKNESRKPGHTTRAEKIKYALQKGLPDDYVETFYDTEDHIYSIKETLEVLNKFTHVNSDTFDIIDHKLNKLSSEVLNTFKDFANGIKEFHKLFKKDLEINIDNVLMEHTIEKTFDKIDILSTHHNVEEHETSSYDILEIDSQYIHVEANGLLNVRQQYGSDGDFAKGDGFETYSSFPFECNISIKINKDFMKSEYKAVNFSVDTNGWYK